MTRLRDPFLSLYCEESHCKNRRGSVRMIISLFKDHVHDCMYLSLNVNDLITIFRADLLLRSLKFWTEFGYLRLQSLWLCCLVSCLSISCYAFHVTSAWTSRLRVCYSSNLSDFPWNILTLSGWRMPWVTSCNCWVSGVLCQWHLCTSCAT